MIEEDVSAPSTPPAYLFSFPTPGILVIMFKLLSINLKANIKTKNRITKNTFVIIETIGGIAIFTETYVASCSGSLKETEPRVASDDVMLSVCIMLGIALEITGMKDDKSNPSSVAIPAFSIMEVVSDKTLPYTMGRIVILYSTVAI